MVILYVVLSKSYNTGDFPPQKDTQSLFIKVSHREESNPVERKVRASMMKHADSFQCSEGNIEHMNMYVCMYKSCYTEKECPLQSKVKRG